jgi:MbtH protein
MSLLHWLRRPRHGDGSDRHATHVIIVNDARDYLVWPVDRTVPPYWRTFGEAGSHEELQARLEELQIDTSPVPLLKRDGP